MLRAWLSVVVLAAVALVPAPASAAPATAAPAGAAPAGAVRWADCGDGFQCGTVDVPLDYTHPAGRRLHCR
jgi:hypothetical protein